MSADILLRAVRASDTAQCLAIYRPHVTDSAVSFEYEPPSEDEFRARILQLTKRHPWFVAELSGRVVGFAYAADFRTRPGYRWTCETTIYVADDVHGRGFARALYERLLAELTQLGYAEALGVIALPNDRSVAFHERLGFHAVGRIEHCGWKHGRWHAIGFWQRTLSRAEPVSAPMDWVPIERANEPREKS